MRFIDLSHSIENGLVTYRGLPAPIICDYMSREESKRRYEDGTSFHIGKIEMVANTGTYLDAPFHRFEGATDISELPLESLSNVAGVVVHVPGGIESITEGFFASEDVAGKAVLIRTGWSRHWRTDRYFEHHPFLTEGAAKVLRDGGARIVGIDSYNIDDIGDGRRPVHTTLLGAGIPIVEHMCNLAALPERGFDFYATPAKVRGFGTFPVRAYAVVSA